jgi:hypothetical protein
MSNSTEEYYKSDAWLDTKNATFGNIQNNFTGGLRHPANYNYIFYKSNTERVCLHTNSFELPIFKVKILDKDLSSRLYSNQLSKFSRDVSVAIFNASTEWTATN